MALIPSLCAALDRVAGDRVTLKEGEPPHVAAGNDRHPIARSPLTHAAIQAMLEEILTAEGRRTLAETGTATETLDKAPIKLIANAAVVDRQISIELLRADVVATAPEPAPAQTPPVVTSEVPFVPADAGRDEPAPSAISPTPVTPEPHRMSESPVSNPAPVEVPVPVAASAPVAAPAIVPAAPPVIAASVPSPQPALRTATPGDLAGWTSHAISLGASALYLRAGHSPVARIAERMEPLDGQVIDAAAIDRMSSALNGDASWRAGANGEWISENPAHGQAICQVFTDHLGTALVIRLRQKVAASVLDRQIPRQVRVACDGDGLLVASANNPAEMLAMGSTVADWSGRRRGAYVIALRPKGSAVHDIGGAFVSQREFEGGDAEVAAAIRRAVHEGPDVLLIAGAQGERTMREAVSAASAARLVILAVVAPSTAQALRTVAAQGDAESAAEHLGLLVQTFRAGFSLRGLRRIGGGRTYVCDVAVAHPEINALLTLGDFAGVTRVQSTGIGAMRTIDGALARAVVRGHLSLRQAAGHAADASQLVKNVRALRRSGRSPIAAAPQPATDAAATDVEVSLDQESMMAGVASGASSARRWSRFGR